MTIYYHPQYSRSYGRLDSPLRRLVDERIKIFRADAFDPRIDTHRLHGKLKKQWSFSIDRRNRVLFEFLNKAKSEVVFLDVGDHSIYR